jgi:hypothetical protein
MQEQALYEVALKQVRKDAKSVGVGGAIARHAFLLL